MAEQLVNRIRLLIMVIVLVPLLFIAANILVYDSTPPSLSNNSSSGGPPNGGYTSFSVGGKVFKLTYVATNESALEKGLMGVKVTNETTELFVFPSAGYYSFWMFGVNSSLDIMWVDAAPGSDSGTFVYLALGAPPCHVAAICTTYYPAAKANFVIEAKAGFAAANGVRVGTHVTLG